MKTITGTSKRGLTVTTSVRVIAPEAVDWRALCERFDPPLRLEPDDSGAFAGVLSALAIELAIATVAILICKLKGWM